MSATAASAPLTGRVRPGPGQVDVRGPRFGAAITSVLLIAALVLGPWPGVIVLAIQTLAFAAGAVLGVSRQPYGLFFRSVVRPRIAPASEFEDAAAPRFAQGVGLAFAIAGLAGVVFSLPVLFYVAVAFALVAAGLNALFGFCLGCEMYLLGKRFFGSSRPSTGNATQTG
ncbi:Hypothetical protein PFCIRM516_04415 [Propionibacterium freudenreichii]|uniref:Integral membrane protein n=1 Tax=Propionibacterium freudenreichii TaxID=1744 RepID=A0A2C7AMB2_9ACTN|nr:DUF4395 domain-containing protein [Propionibacterium freudenreichii]CEI24575.1 Hypothetical protein PFCIRM516_04415 [Propionibacterium freudenreichii]SPB30272.1 hypothetical protein MAJHIDBO_00569 [Propionibacterium freudenreichii subsp. shermanii]SPS08386.1 hypothetical protein MAJHIDBO_00569 [Propionibacterium freudenreichii subsp. shermanii]